MVWAVFSQILNVILPLGPLTALARLRAVAPTADEWNVRLPTERDPSLGISWGAGAGQRAGREILNAATGEPVKPLETLGGRTHEVVSGLCLLTPAWEELHSETTLVTFRELTARDIGAYLATGEWEGRAGGYAIQGRGAALVERIEGDYLNVVGLPGALLIRLLAARFGGSYVFG